MIIRKKELVIVILILSVVIIFASAIFRGSRKDGNKNSITNSLKEDVASLLDLAGLDGGVRSDLERSRIAEMDKLREEKILRDQAALEQLPKFDRVTFFLQAPLMGSLALPIAWEGKYLTQEAGNRIDFNCIDQAQARPMFSVRWRDSSEPSSEVSDQGKFRLLSEAGRIKFYYQEFDQKNSAAECQKMMKDFEQVIKSFKSGK